VTVLILIGLAAAGCNTPRPDYAVVKLPPPYRTDNGTIVDNEDYGLDAEGYRLDKRGRRIGLVDIEARMGNDVSNPMAGYYISSIGAKAPGQVMAPSEGAAAGAGYGPGSANPMPSGTTPIPTPMPTR
jgi:hypothetical protein